MSRVHTAFLTKFAVQRSELRSAEGESQATATQLIWAPTLVTEVEKGLLRLGMAEYMPVWTVSELQIR